MARELLVVWAGRRQRATWEALCEDYRQRIRRLTPVRDVPVKARASGDEVARLKLESEALAAALPDPSWTIALSRTGQMVSSLELARELASLRERWPHAISFVVGSDLGLDPVFVERARQRLSLGPMTLPHELARLVLYEQLYRALAIAAGINYHREPLR